MVLSIPYVVAGAVPDLIDGVFVSPQSRRDLTYLATPDLVHLVPAIVVVSVLLLRGRVDRRRRNLLDAGIAAVVVLALIGVFASPAAYVLFFSSGSGMASVTVVVGAMLLITGRGPADPRRRELLLLLLALVGCLALVQFPFGAPVYYFYVAPVVAIAVVALLGDRSPGGDAFPCVLLAAFVVFGASVLDRGDLEDLGIRMASSSQTQTLADNASVHVSPRSKNQHNEVSRLLREHSRGAYAYAGPDLPQLYFLSGLENPTRSLFDSLDTSRSARGRALVDTLRVKGVTALAIRLHPDLSDPLEPGTLRELRRRYPNGRRVGGIEVRWASSPIRPPTSIAPGRSGPRRISARRPPRRSWPMVQPFRALRPGPPADASFMLTAMEGGGESLSVAHAVNRPALSRSGSPRSAATDS